MDPNSGQQPTMDRNKIETTNSTYTLALPRWLVYVPQLSCRLVGFIFQQYTESLSYDVFISFSRGVEHHISSIPDLLVEIRSIIHSLLTSEAELIMGLIALDAMAAAQELKHTVFYSIKLFCRVASVIFWTIVLLGGPFTYVVLWLFTPPLNGIWWILETGYRSKKPKILWRRLRLELYTASPDYSTLRAIRTTLGNLGIMDPKAVPARSDTNAHLLKLPAELRIQIFDQVGTLVPYGEAENESDCQALRRTCAQLRYEFDDCMRHKSMFLIRKAERDFLKQHGTRLYVSDQPDQKILVAFPLSFALDWGKKFKDNYGVDYPDIRRSLPQALIFNKSVHFGCYDDRKSVGPVTKRDRGFVGFALFAWHDLEFGWHIQEDNRRFLEGGWRMDENCVKYGVDEFLRLFPELQHQIDG